VHRSGEHQGLPNDALEVGLPIKIVYEDIPGEEVTLWRFGPR
jgi:hypothetical protein